MEVQLELMRPTIFGPSAIAFSLAVVCSLAAHCADGADAPKSEAQSVKTTPDTVLSAAEKQTALADLRKKNLSMPLDGVDVQRLKGSFDEDRGGRPHHAVDILAERNTPVKAVEDGILARIFESEAGGHTIYETDPSNKYVYYYAHLEKYADGLKNGDKIKRGQVIGYVGTSGNAPPNTPHLHFSIGVMGPEKRHWQVADVDPYEVFSK